MALSISDTRSLQQESDRVVYGSQNDTTACIRCFLYDSNTKGYTIKRYPVLWSRLPVRIIRLVESFFKTLKKECVRKYIFKTREEAKRKIFEYIEMFYNSKRRHSYLNYLSPNNFEIRYYADIKKEEVLAADFVSMK